jgi:predicted nuclease with TOPRIM domain
MGLSVSNIKESYDIVEVVRSINKTNNEMTQDFNNLRNELLTKESEIEALKREVNSLSIKLGEISASTQKSQSVQKRVVGKNVKLGTSDASTVKTATLFKDSAGSLIWSDDSGVQTTIVA